MDHFCHFPIGKAGFLAIEADKRVSKFASLPGPARRASLLVSVDPARFLERIQFGIEAFVAFDRQVHLVRLCGEQGDTPGTDLQRTASTAEDELLVSVETGQVRDLAALKSEYHEFVDNVRRDMNDVHVDITGIAGSVTPGKGPGRRET